MAWSHIVIEAYCSFDKEDNNFQLSENSNCKWGYDHFGVHCLTYNEGEHKYCPFLGFTAARATIVLTDEAGVEVACDSFFTEESLSNEQWLKREKDWIENWKKRLKSAE